MWCNVLDIRTHISLDICICVHTYMHNMRMGLYKNVYYVLAHKLDTLRMSVETGTFCLVTQGNTTATYKEMFIRLQ